MNSLVSFQEFLIKKDFGIMNPKYPSFISKSTPLLRNSEDAFNMPPDNNG